MSDKTTFMRNWTDEMMNVCFTKENIKDFISKSYLALFQISIFELCNEHIPKQIAADRRQVNNIANDRRTSQEILRVFQPLQRGIREIQAEVLFFKLRFMDKDVIKIEDLRKVKRIGDGSFSEVYLARWKIENEIKDVALKVLKGNMSGLEMYSQLSEVECLRYL